MVPFLTPAWPGPRAVKPIQRFRALTLSGMRWKAIFLPGLDSGPLFGRRVLPPLAWGLTTTNIFILLSTAGGLNSWEIWERKQNIRREKLSIPLAKLPHSVNSYSLDTLILWANRSRMISCSYVECRSRLLCRIKSLWTSTTPLVEGLKDIPNNIISGIQFEIWGFSIRIPHRKICSQMVPTPHSAIRIPHLKRPTFFRRIRSQSRFAYLLSRMADPAALHLSVRCFFSTTPLYWKCWTFRFPCCYSWKESTRGENVEGAFESSIGNSLLWKGDTIRRYHPWAKSGGQIVLK